MSCRHCTHCQEAERAAKEAADVYAVGTPLEHSKLGRVKYWRGAPDVSPTSHVVELDNGEMAYVDIANLTTV